MGLPSQRNLRTSPVATCQGPVRASLMTLPALSQLVLATGDATFPPWVLNIKVFGINDVFESKVRFAKVQPDAEDLFACIFSNDLYNHSNLRT